MNKSLKIALEILDFKFMTEMLNFVSLNNQLIMKQVNPLTYFVVFVFFSTSFPTGKI